MRRHLTWLAGVLAAGGLGVSGCATHEYVDQSIAAHNAENQQQFASTNSRIDQVSADAQAALARAAAAHKLAEGNFQHSVLFTDDSVHFDTASANLSSDGQTALTALADKIKADNKNVYIEIEGHADTRGSMARNDQLGSDRAEAVRQFLHAQGIPLAHMDTISYGETKPTGKGDTEDRRAVVVVMN